MVHYDEPCRFAHAGSADKASATPASGAAAVAPGKRQRRIKVKPGEEPIQASHHFYPFSIHFLCVQLFHKTELNCNITYFTLCIDDSITQGNKAGLAVLRLIKIAILHRAVRL